jgi:hypothetical protein
MLVLQMAVTHILVMRRTESLYRLIRGSYDIAEHDAVSVGLSRLQKAFTNQIDAFNAMRRGGRQKVIVEHVHVYPGGQAIVGNVTNTPGVGGSEKKEQQPHAAISYAPGETVWSTDPKGQPMRFAASLGQAALPDARGSGRVGSAERRAKRKLSARPAHGGGHS